jgi:hypothetical protein
MKFFLNVIIAILILTSCDPSSNKTTAHQQRVELTPEPDKAERLEYEAFVKLKNSGCLFSDPDTSLSGITIRNSESATALIGTVNQIDSLEQYHFYSKLDREALTLKQHPGDGKNQISIFKVEYSNKANHGYIQLPIDTFKTEKGIKLGISKKQIIEKLGTCYVGRDSTKNYIELFYRIELPKDSNTNLLKENNMPIYYASYKLRNDRLEKFEFGFEYP